MCNNNWVLCLFYQQEDPNSPISIIWLPYSFPRQNTFHVLALPLQQTWGIKKGYIWKLTRPWHSPWPKSLTGLYQGVEIRCQEMGLEVSRHCYRLSRRLFPFFPKNPHIIQRRWNTKLQNFSSIVKPLTQHSNSYVFLITEKDPLSSDIISTLVVSLSILSYLGSI